MKRIQINYKPLDKSVNLRTVSGSLTQQYNATAQEYIPDFALVPLVIQPDIYITDPDGVITAGLKNSSLTDITWYENAVLDSKAITSSNTSYVIDTSATETRGRITVKKNIPEAEQLVLIFTAKFLDTRTGMSVPVSGSVQLCVVQAVESSTPRLVSHYPVGTRLYPTTGQRGLKIDCKLVAGDVTLSPVWKWQIYENSAWRDLVEADNVKGLGTSRLWVPAEIMSKQTKVKTTAILGGKSYAAEHVLGIAYERYHVDIIAPGDGEVSPDMESVTVKAKIWNNKGTIEKPETYFKIEWFDGNNIKLGEGETLDIAKAKYAINGFGVELKVSEKYTALVLGETVWIADFYNNQNASLVLGDITGFTATMCSLKFGSSGSSNTVEFIHNGKPGQLFIQEYVSGTETILFGMMAYEKLMDINIVRQLPEQNTKAVIVTDIAIKTGQNTLSFSCLKDSVFGFYGDINGVAYDVQEDDFYDADLLPMNPVKTFTLSTKGLQETSSQGILLKSFKAGNLKLNFETEINATSGSAVINTQLTGVNESDFIKQLTI